MIVADQSTEKALTFYRIAVYKQVVFAPHADFPKKSVQKGKNLMYNGI